MKRQGTKWITGLLVLAIVPTGVWILVRSQAAGQSPQTSSTQSPQKQLWTCSMHPQVIRDEPGKCPICNMKLVPVKAVSHAPAPTTAPAEERKIKYWWDPMLGPSSIRSHPGKSAMGMDLVPVYEDAAPAANGELVIDPAVVQNMGLTLATVKHGPLIQTIRAAGFLTVAQPRQYDVNLRISGWIQKLDANISGMSLKKGQPLFELYSPQLTIAVGELISARQAAGSGGKAIYESARNKLVRWGIPLEQVDQLAALNAPPPAITFVSPVDGILAETDVVEGSAVNAAQRIMRITDQSVLWLEAEIFPQDLPFVHVGQAAQVDVEGAADTSQEAKVVFIAPQVDAMTRTTRVRMELPNKDLKLRPGMYASVSFHSQIEANALLAPRSAVIDTGTRQVVFVAKGHGHFEARDVKTGAVGSGDSIQILSGLSAGDQVVVSGQFLLDADSRMQEAIRRFMEQ